MEWMVSHDGSRFARVERRGRTIVYWVFLREERRRSTPKSPPTTNIVWQAAWHYETYRPQITYLKSSESLADALTVCEVHNASMSLQVEGLR